MVNDDITNAKKIIKKVIPTTIIMKTLIDKTKSGHNHIVKALFDRVREPPRSETDKERDRNR